MTIKHLLYSFNIAIEVREAMLLKEILLMNLLFLFGIFPQEGVSSGKMIFMSYSPSTTLINDIDKDRIFKL